MSRLPLASILEGTFSRTFENSFSAVLNIFSFTAFFPFSRCMPCEMDLGSVNNVKSKMTAMPQAKIHIHTGICRRIKLSRQSLQSGVGCSPSIAGCPQLAQSRVDTDATVEGVSSIPSKIKLIFQNSKLLADLGKCSNG